MSKEVTKISHGSESWWSPYKMLQHQYYAGEAGFIELLEIQDAPVGEAAFVIHDYLRSYDISSYSEWKSLAEAVEAFEQTAGLTFDYVERGQYPKLPGYIRSIHCKAKQQPWFYET